MRFCPPRQLFQEMRPLGVNSLRAWGPSSAGYARVQVAGWTFMSVLFLGAALVHVAGMAWLQVSSSRTAAVVIGRAPDTAYGPMLRVQIPSLTRDVVAEASQGSDGYRSGDRVTVLVSKSDAAVRVEQLTEDLTVTTFAVLAGLVPLVPRAYFRGRLRAARKSDTLPSTSEAG